MRNILLRIAGFLCLLLISSPLLFAKSMGETKSFNHYYFQQDTTKRDTTKKVPTPVPADSVKAPVNPLGGASPVQAAPPKDGPATAPAGAAGQKTITGVVLDEKKIGLPGVGIKIQGKTGGSVTQENGRFSIAVTAPTDVLVFSYIGYQTKSIPAGNGTAPLTVNLVPSASQKLDEVVVVGYGTLKAKEVTSAIATVDTSQFRQSGSRNPLDLLQGKVAGLQITRTGGSNPNSGVGVQLRGVTSVTGSQSPLIVIDGIPGGNLDLLQQDDIASFSVLKDGSGAAIYGTRANAGVILVTTKKGKAGPARFDYSGYLRKEYLYQRPDFLTVDEFREKIRSGQFDRQDYGASLDPFNDLVNKENLSQNHNLSMSGGSEKTSYRASINYRDLQGFAKNNRRTEYGIRLNLNSKGLDDKLFTQVNLSTNFNKGDLLGGGGWENQLTRNPTQSYYNPDGSWFFDPNATNELARLEQETNKRQQQTSSIDAKAEYEIFKGFKASVFGAVQRNSYIDGSYRSVFGEYSLENDIYKNGGYAARSTVLEQNFNVEPTLQYATTFGDDHSLTAIGGYSYRYEVNEGFNAGNLGFLNDQFQENNLNAGNQLSAGKAFLGSFKNDNTLIAFFGRVNYTFKNRYYLQAILRREGSSRFGVNNKWANFPAVSAGWTVTEEKFMENVKWVNNLKVRVGYGETGNSGISNYASLVTLGTGGVYLYPDGQYRETYGPNTNPNPNLRWEKKQEINLGLDFTLFSSRLSGSLDLFKRVTKDLLDNYDSPQPPFVRSSIYTNVGSISAKGIELALSYQAVKGKDFKYNIDLAASTTSNKLDSYSNSEYKRDYLSTSGIGGFGDLGNSIRIYEGGKIGDFWGKRFAGFTADGKWLFFNRNGQPVRNDQINNSFNRDQTDLAVIGNAIPKYYLSLTNSFNYKQFDLRVFLRGKFDYQILNTTALSYGNKVSGTNLLSSAFDKYAQINDTYMYSDYYIEDGSFLKIDEVTFGYTFKLKSKNIRNLRAYITGQNLATFTKYTGNDPDFVKDTGLGQPANDGVLGVDGRGPYPSTSSFLLGVSFGF